MNPLRYVDLLGKGHVEPSSTGLVEVQTTEPIPPSAPPQTLLIISSFRSGVPKHLYDFTTLSALQNVHDPDNNADVGVALARVARRGFGDLDVFGAADMSTIRVDPALNSSTFLKLATMVNLIKIETGDYGAHTVRSRVTVGAGTFEGKKLTLWDDVRRFEKDNLGEFLTVRYTGDGASCVLDVTLGTGIITYTGVPADGATLTVNGVQFEFDPASPPVAGGGGVPVKILAGDEPGTWANLRDAIEANVPNLESVTIDTTNTKILVKGEEHGVALIEGSDVGAHFAVSSAPPTSRFRTTVGGGTANGKGPDLDIPMKLSGYATLDRLVSAINTLGGGFYTATISQYANKFLPSNGLDPVVALDIKSANRTLTGYVSAIVDWVNNGTRGNFLATEVARGEPDEVIAQAFTGGTSSVALFADYFGTSSAPGAFDVAAAQIEKGATVLLNSDDPAILAAAATWVEEQRGNGKWFRVYAGLAPALTPAQILAQVAQYDHTRIRCVAQRLGVITDNSGGLTYLDPAYMAAAMAGGAAGNLPYVKTLTNKRFAFAGIHPDDSWDVEIRESLITGGVIVAKKEQDRTVCVLHVTTSRDPLRRMPRIASEIDTVDLIDGQMREGYLQMRGVWAGADIGARVYLTGNRILNEFVRVGAIVRGKSEEGQEIPAWRWLPIFAGNPFVLQGGVLKVAYQIFIGGELDHVSLHGVAEYARLVAEISGGRLVNLTTAVTVR